MKWIFSKHDDPLDQLPIVKTLAQDDVTILVRTQEKACGHTGYLFDIRLLFMPKGERLTIGLFSEDEIHAIVNLLTQAAQFMDAERTRSEEPTLAGD